MVTYSGVASYVYMKEYPESTLKTSAVMTGPDFDDPMDDIINSYRDIGLRMSILEAVVNNNGQTNGTALGPYSLPKPFISQSVDYVSHQARVEYQANPRALGLAVVISLLGPLATLTLFWGYWKLGRNFSMSPLELANAFLVRGHMPPMSSSSTKCQGAQDYCPEIQHQYQHQHQHEQPQQYFHQHHQQPELATLLASCSSNASAKQITKHCARKRNDGRWWSTFFQFNNKREPRLQYGVLESTGQLGFAVEDEQGVIHARRPREGEML